MENIQDLKDRLETATGIDKANILRHLSEAYLETSLKESLEYGQLALEAAKILENNEETANALSHLGVIYLNISDYGKALEYQREALRIREIIGVNAGIAKSLNNIGNAYLYQGDYGQALDYYLKSLSLQEEIGDKKGIAMAINNIGFVYDNLKNYDKALEYFFSSLKLFEELGDKYYISGSLNNIGNIYHHFKDYDKALDYFLRSLKIKEELGNKSRIANALINIGEVYFYLNKFDQALEYYTKAMEIIQEMGNNWSVCNTLTCIAKVYIKLGGYDLAGEKLAKAFDLAKAIEAKELIKNCHSSYSDLYEARGDFQKALEHYRLYAETKDSIFTEDSSKKIAEMQTKYETEKKEKEAEIYRLRNVELAEANQAITQAKEIIEEKNRHITSSIEYARRIQQAVLPPAGKMQATLPEHFVLFKPRDIVSGDFYWFSQTGGKILIAVVDCTGHGVPGAFMSMIGSMLLNTIVNENGETSPAKVLEQLHIAVRSALKQHDAEADTTDGMDVSLCAIEQGSKRLVYAGAKRPLYLVRNNELTEITGDGKSIGGRQKEEKRAFSEKQLSLQTGDMLYLTSDGYSDQCDAEGRKIGSRRLKELLIKISGQDPAAQREALLSELERHQGTEEQRDDIAIVGFLSERL